WRRPRACTLFPYTPLFRSLLVGGGARAHVEVLPGGGDHCAGDDRRGGGGADEHPGRGQRQHRCELEGHVVCVHTERVYELTRFRSEEHTSELQSREKLVCR